VSEGLGLCWERPCLPPHITDLKLPRGVVLAATPAGKYMLSPTEASGIMISGRDFEFGEVGSVKCSASPLRPELDVGSRS
jgi:hypothetical protein